MLLFNEYYKEDCITVSSKYSSSSKLTQLKQDKPVYKKGCTDKAANQTG